MLFRPDNCALSAEMGFPGAPLARCLGFRELHASTMLMLAPKPATEVAPATVVAVLPRTSAEPPERTLTGGRSMRSRASPSPPPEPVPKDSIRIGRQR